MSVTTVTRVAQNQGLRFEFRSMYACYGCLSRILCYPVRIRACNDPILHPDYPDACKTMNEEASLWFLTLISRTVLPKVVFFPFPRNILCLSSYRHALTIWHRLLDFAKLPILDELKIEDLLVLCLSCPLPSCRSRYSAEFFFHIQLQFVPFSRKTSVCTHVNTHLRALIYWRILFAYLENWNAWQLDYDTLFYMDARLGMSFWGKTGDDGRSKQITQNTCIGDPSGFTV